MLLAKNAAILKRFLPWPMQIGFIVSVMVSSLAWLPVAMAAQPSTTQETEWPKGHYPLPEEGNIIGEADTFIVKDYDDTLIDIAKRHNLGYLEMTRANPEVSIWVPGVGTEVTIPGRFILPNVERTGVVINIAELRLYYYPDVKNGETPRVETYPIGIGREGFDTPLGVTETTMNIKNPAWYPPESVKREAEARGETAPSVVPPGPDNPLGDHAIILGFDGYLIHGTNQPDGIGMRASRGCIRMLPDDIESIFDRIPAGTQVNIINQPIKIGWDNGQPLVQAFPPLGEEEHSMAALSETVTRLNQYNVDNVNVDYEQLSDVLSFSSGLITLLHPNPEQEPQRHSPEEKAIEGIYEELVLTSSQRS